MNKIYYATRTCVAILLVISLTACATRLGRSFDDTAAKDIKSGETTKAVLMQMLGQPSLVIGIEAEEVWTYAYYRGRFFVSSLARQLGLMNADVQTQGTQKRLVVKFAGDNVREWQLREEIPLANRANR